jgi:hypothetical protein
MGIASHGERFNSLHETSLRTKRPRKLFGIPLRSSYSRSRAGGRDSCLHGKWAVDTSSSAGGSSSSATESSALPPELEERPGRRWGSGRPAIPPRAGQTPARRGRINTPATTSTSRAVVRN